jgi:mRNA-degrading endonuclease RelE of RelBE toxin-antitoxin system
VAKREIRNFSEYITLQVIYKDKIKEILVGLKQNPYGSPYKKIKGESCVYRIRVGKYRIIHEINKNHNQIIIIKVDKRERVYE